MGSLPQHDLPNTIHRRNPHGSTIQTVPEIHKVSTRDTMDRAVRIAGALTNAIRIMLKEPSINAGRHAKSLEQLTHIFETAIEKLEKDMRTKHRHRPHPQQKNR